MSVSVMRRWTPSCSISNRIVFCSVNLLANYLSFFCILLTLTLHIDEKIEQKEHREACISSSPGLLTSFSDESDFLSNEAGNVSDDPNEKEKSRRFLNLDDIIGDLQRDEIHPTTRLPEDSPDELLDQVIK